MKFSPGILQVDKGDSDVALLCERLRPGWWLVEVGCNPLASHEPALLLEEVVCQSGMAITLRTDTLLRLDLGSALIARLEAEGCVVHQLATVAVHEILLNAAIHGNLEVVSGPATAWADLAARQSLIEAALQDPVRAARLVTVAIGWHGDSVEAVVVDEGAGYRCRTSPPVPGATRRGAGHGLIIARAAGRVEVFDGGCRTRLIFARVGSAAAP